MKRAWIALVVLAALSPALQRCEGVNRIRDSWKASKVAPPPTAERLDARKPRKGEQGDSL